MGRLERFKEMIGLFGSEGFGRGVTGGNGDGGGLMRDAAADDADYIARLEAMAG